MIRFAISLAIAGAIAAGSGATRLVPFALDTRAELQAMLSKVAEVQR